MDRLIAEIKVDKDEMRDVCEETVKNMVKNGLLVVKAKSGINLKADLMDHWHKEILKMKETGVIVLPWFLEAEVVPDDVEVQILDPKSSCVLEEGFEC